MQNEKMKRRAFLCALCAVGAASAAGCARMRRVALDGMTMGTRYSVKLIAPARAVRGRDLHTEIDRTLSAIDRAMSTYNPDSELSQLNRNLDPGRLETSPGIFAVVNQALRLSARTNGAFDVTVGPLVELWGFGPAVRGATLPGAELIERTKLLVGYGNLQTDANARAIARNRPGVQLDLSSIAKGYGVDRVAALLDARGVKDYLVEIGGEFRARGVNADRRPWRVGILEPVPVGGKVHSVVALHSHGIATSGNYLDYFDHGGKRYSHVIDPASGARGYTPAKFGHCHCQFNDRSGRTCNCTAGAWYPTGNPDGAGARTCGAIHYAHAERF